MKNGPESIAVRLKKAMDAAEKKQADLVRETGLDRASISSYLSGKYEPKQKAIYKLAAALNVSENWLMGYDVPMARTDDQKKNDQLAKLIVKLRTNENFYNAVMALSNLPESRYQDVEHLLPALNENFYNTVVALINLPESQYRGVEQLISALKE